MRDPAIDPLAQLQDAFGELLCRSAERLIEIGCVLDVRILQGGSVVTGIVAAEAGRRTGNYRVYIKYRTGRRSCGALNTKASLSSTTLDSNAPTMEGDCSCGERSPCVHVAAVSITAEKQALAPTPAPPRTAVEPPLQLAAAPPTRSSPAQQQRLYYVLEKSRLETAGRRPAGGIQISAWVGQTMLGSENIRTDSLHPFAARSSPGSAEFPRYVDPRDKEILKALSARQFEGPWEIHGDAAGDLLGQIIATGRAFWQSQVNLLPALARYLQTSLAGEAVAEGEALPPDDDSGSRVGEQWLVLLDDGRYLPIAIDRIQRIANTLVELFDRNSLTRHEALSLPTSQTGRLAQLSRELSGPVLRSDDSSLRALIEDLEASGGIQPMAAPAHSQAVLRPYQEEGLGWLQFLRHHRLGGILADDMGLGKTVQTLAYLALEKQHGRLHKPSLIVAPVSTLGNWQQEIRRFAPELQCLTLHGSRRRESFPLIDKVDVVITGYPLLQLDSDILLAREFYLLILDEAQTIKNPRAKVSQAARALRADYRLCLTGTPVENHLGELWSLFDFVQPGLLGDERHFQRHYRTPIEKNGNRPRAQALAQRLAPFLLRRTKDAVAKDLPPKTEIVEAIALDDKQRDFYDGIRLATHRHIQEVVQQQGLARSQIAILDALLKLRQACCDPRLLGVTAAREDIPSAKLDWLSTVLPQLIAEGRRVLLFSQFTSMLRLIEAAVIELSIPYCQLTGETQNRPDVIARFQSGAAPLFLISLKAGGTGLNLTAADTVIHYDPWWNPAVEAQATDRAHRIGQDKPVFVYKLIAQGTVEEKIMQLQAAKYALANRLYTQGNAPPASWTVSDLEALFAP